MVNETGMIERVYRHFPKEADLEDVMSKKCSAPETSTIQLILFLSITLPNSLFYSGRVSSGIMLNLSWLHDID